MSNYPSRPRKGKAEVPTREVSCEVPVDPRKSAAQIEEVCLRALRKHRKMAALVGVPMAASAVYTHPASAPDLAAVTLSAASAALVAFFGPGDYATRSVARKQTPEHRAPYTITIRANALRVERESALDAEAQRQSALRLRRLEREQREREERLAYLALCKGCTSQQDRRKPCPRCSSHAGRQVSVWM